MYTRMACQDTNAYHSHAQVTPSCTQICADHPQPQHLSERRSRYCCLTILCTLLHFSGDARGRVGMLKLQDSPFLLPPCSTMQNHAQRLRAPGPESILSPFFLSTRRHPTKESALAFKRFLFVRHGLPWIGCIHGLTVCLGLLPFWLQIRQNAEQEPDTNFSPSKEILSSKMSRKQKTLLLLTQSSHSAWLSRTSRQQSIPAWSDCQGDRERRCPMPENLLLRPNGLKLWTGNAKLFPSSPLLGGEAWEACLGQWEEKNPVFPADSAKGKLKTS